MASAGGEAWPDTAWVDEVPHGFGGHALQGNLTIDTGPTGRVILGETARFRIVLGQQATAMHILGGEADIGDGWLSFADFDFHIGEGFSSGIYTLMTAAGGVAGTLGAGTSGSVGGHQARLVLEDNSLMLRVEGPSRPVALVGDSYGRYDVISITRNIFDRSDWVFEERGDFLPAEEFGRYSLVVICYKQSRPYSVDEHALIRDYVLGGGRILLLNQAPNWVYDSTDPDSVAACMEWMGFVTVRNGALLDADPDTVDVADHPLLDGVVSAHGSRPSWVTGDRVVRNLASGTQVLIGSAENALATRRTLGAGEVFFLGPELFRLRNETSPHHVDSWLYAVLIRNIFTAVSPLTVSDWRLQLAADWRDQGERFLLWNREWQRGTEDGPVFLPPLPAADEVMGTLEINLALDEFEAVQINISNVGAGGLLTWSTQLDGLPSRALEVFVQDQPDPIPWPANPAIAKESPFWLMPATAVDPGGQEAVTIAAEGTRILWLKWNTHHLDPGEYHADITFFVDGMHAGSVDLNVTLHPFRVPARRPISLRPAGHVYGDVNNLPPALRFKRNLRDHGFEWSLVNVFRAHTLFIDGTPLSSSWLQGHIADIESTAPPVLDFTAMDPFVDAALEHNLTHFSTVSGITSTIDSLSANAGLDPAQSTAVRHWFVGEFVRYMQDKGIRNLYASRGDELSDEALRHEFLPWSIDLAAAGMKSTSSFTTASVADPDLTAQLAPTVGAWTLNRQFLATLRGWIREGSLDLPEGTLVGTYGAGEGRGTEIRKPPSASRMIGWEAWDQNSDYCSPNPYFKGWIYYTDYSLDRGLAGERFVAYLDMNDFDAPLLNSAFIEGIRESMEEANLAWKMSWYMQQLGTRVPTGLRSRAAAIIGSGEDTLLRYSTGAGEERFNISATREQYASAKREVLAILTELKPLIDAHLQPSAYWHRQPLVIDGQPVAAIITHRDAAVLQNAIQSVCGQTLPITEVRPVDEQTVIYFATADDPSLPVGFQQRVQRRPTPASWIQDWTEDGQTIIWVGATDADELAKAATNFGRFLHPYRADKLRHRSDLLPMFPPGLKAGGFIGKPFSYQIPVAAYPPVPVHSSDPLPPGLSLDPATGEIAGIPSAAGIYWLTLQAEHEWAATSAMLAVYIGEGGLAATPGFIMWAEDHGLNPYLPGAADTHATAYAFGLDPGRRTAASRAMTDAGGGLILEYLELEYGATYHLQHSADLQTWDDSSIVRQISGNQSYVPQGYRRGYFPIPATHPYFYRLLCVFDEYED